MRNILKLNQEQTNSVLVNANLLMQILDEQKKSPLKTFDYIRRFAKLVQERKGENFSCNINSYNLEENNLSKLYVIEPPCGSNTYILQIQNELLFVDSGFACYKNEMAKIFRELISDFNNKNKTSFITHADVDHVGLLNTFDKNYMSKNCYENFVLEHNH